ncbi:MAG: preprotein translocase subunit SecA, partial [Sciscionella sp.]
AQRDPLIEYQREGFEMFNAMLDALKEESIGFLFNLQVEAAEPEPAAEVPEETPAEKTAVLAPIGGRSARNNGVGDSPTQQLPAIRTGPRHAMSEDGENDYASAALHGKGLDGGDDGARLTYSGPAEGGGVASHGDSGENGDSGNGAAGGSRRKRRETARAQAKADKKRSRR